MTPPLSIIAPFLLVFVLLLVTAATEVIDVQMAEEMSIGSVIADLRMLIEKNGKLSDSQWMTFKSAGSDDIGHRLVDVTPEGKLIVSHRIDREKLCPLHPLSMLSGPQAAFGGHSASSTGAFNFPPQSNLPPSLISSNGQCVFTLRVASDVKNDAQASTIHQLRITVLDVNDQAPFWPDNLQRHVIEFRDGDPADKRQSLPLAIDLDQGENARISYSIEQDALEQDSLPFKLLHDPTAGSLYLQTEREIDHEVTSSYKLLLKAIDGIDKSLPDNMVSERFLRQHTSSLALTVVVQDINDNDPQFTHPVFTPEQTVSETTPVGSVVLRLAARDADSGVNGAFHFAFAPNADWRSVDILAQHLFDVRPNGNVVVRRPLDVDRQWKIVDELKKSPSGVSLYGSSESLKGMEISFKVIVVDEADSPYTRSSEATVNIFVRDENDEAPTIEVMRPATSAECVKSLGKPTAIGPGRVSSQVSYACVFENAPTDTFVATVQVSDLDFRGEDEHECRLDNNNFSLIAEEHANSQLLANQLTHVFNSQALKSPGVSQYAILTATPLDREVTPLQYIQVLCSDHANHQSVHNLTVLIGDINDHKPQFFQEIMSFQVAENSPPGTLLKPLNPPASVGRQGTSMATDADVGKYGMVKYSFVEGSRTAENFSIDPLTGVISTRVPFDRESKSKYIFSVLAVDQADGDEALTGTGTVEVTILDVNDNPPVFGEETYTFQIMENLPRGTRVGQVTAFDLDDQGPVSYYLSNDHDGLVFQIDRTSGELFTRRPLDREDQSNYTFKVLVRDFTATNRGLEKKSHTATATVTVVLEDENDNSPTFILPNATANTLSVAVSQTLGHKLAVIIASDADEGDNGRITYKIKAGNSLNLFSIDPQSGLLFLADSLSRFDKAVNGSSGDDALGGRSLQLPFQPTVHVITLEACDCGIEPRCTVSPNLRIHVQPERRYPSGDGEENMLETERFREDAQTVGGTGQYLPLPDGSINGGGEARHPGWNGVKASTQMSGLRGWAGGSNEVILISMSVLFVILLVAILALTLLLRNCKIGPTKQMSVSATQQSLSRSKTPTYVGTMPGSPTGTGTGGEASESVMGTFSGSPPPSGVIQSQSEMLLCHRAGEPMVPQLPKSLTQDFATFVPSGYPGKKHSAAVRSNDILMPLKYAGVPNNNKEMTPQGQMVDKVFVSHHHQHHPYVIPRSDTACYGEYQTLQANGLYGIEKANEAAQNAKNFNQNIYVPRFLASSGRVGNHNGEGFPMQRVMEGHPQASYTYGRYAGLKPIQQPMSTNTLDPRFFDQHQQQHQQSRNKSQHHPHQQQIRGATQRLYVRDDFPRSKSVHTVAMPPNKSDDSVASSEGVGEGFKSGGEEESMLLLLPEAEGRSEMSEPLSTNEDRGNGDEAFHRVESQQQMNNAASAAAAATGGSKLVASAYREASFV